MTLAGNQTAGLRRLILVLLEVSGIAPGSAGFRTTVWLIADGLKDKQQT